AEYAGMVVGAVLKAESRSGSAYLQGIPPELSDAAIRSHVRNEIIHQVERTRIQRIVVHRARVQSQVVAERVARRARRPTGRGPIYPRRDCSRASRRARVARLAI